MQPGQPGPVRCSYCGWQNSIGDRMCGGCGQPLFHSGSSFGTPPDATPTVVASSRQVAPPPLPPETRTATWAAPEHPTNGARYTAGSSTVAATPSRAAPPVTPSARAQSRTRRGHCLGRTLLSLAIAALLLLVVAACGWAAVIRPALHSAVDQHLRAGLAAEIDKVPAVPAGFPAITRTITDTTINQQSNASRSQTSQGDMKDVRVHFLPGEIAVTYRLWGSPGKITTHIVALNGRLFVQNTQVQGWLTQIESGSELQDSLNESLARLPAQDYVQSVDVGYGTLTLTLRHA